MTSRLIAGIFLMAVIARPAVAEVTVLFNDAVVSVERTLADPNDLWVLPADLTRINGFELKPEGACDRVSISSSIIPQTYCAARISI